MNTEYIGRRAVLELLIIQALNSSTTLVRIDDKGYTAQELMTIYSYAVNEYYPRVKDIINDDTDYIDLYREYKPIYPIINLKYIRQEDIEKNK